MKSLLIHVALLLIQWRTCVSYCPSGRLNIISGTGDIDVYLGKPEPACFGCQFLGSFNPGTKYTVNGGPLKHGAQVFLNGVLFVQDPSSTFKDGDMLNCTYNGISHISRILFAGPTISPPVQQVDDNLMPNEHFPNDEILERDTRAPMICRNSGVKVGEVGHDRLDNFKCKIIECKKGRFGFLHEVITRVDCNSVTDTSQCTAKDLTKKELEKLKCCKVCMPNSVGALKVHAPTLDNNITTRTTSLVAEWQYAPKAIDNITKVIIAYKAISNNARTSEIVVCYPINMTTITGLNPLTDYEITVIVETDLTPSYGASNVTRTTGKTLSLPASSPMIYSVSTTCTTINITWMATWNTHFQDPTYMYQVKYIERDCENCTVTVVEVNHTEISIWHLTPNTGYKITVSAINSGGVSSDSNYSSITLKTDCDQENSDDSASDGDMTNPDSIATPTQPRSSH